MRWTSLCRTTSSPLKFTNSMSLDVAEDVAHDDEPGALVARQVDLGDVAGDDHLRAEAEPGQEHLHLLGRGVLRLVEDDERVVERAAAHERERRDLDHAALDVGVDALRRRACRSSASNSGRRYGSTFAIMVAGQEAEPLARLDRRPREDDPVDLAPRQRGGRHRHREVGLAGAGRADPERDRVVADRVDVALLVDGLRRDARRAMRPDDVPEDRRGALVLVERGVTAPIVPGEISWPWAISSDSSSTTSRPTSTASARRRASATLPRRKTSQSRWPSSARRTASSEPASSVATEGSSVICVRRLSRELRPHAAR